MANFGTLTTNTSTSTVVCNGPCIFHSAGTWGSGTLVLQFLSSDGTTWKTWNTDTALTSDATGQILIDVPVGAKLSMRATLSGSSGASIAWEFRGIL
jgi:hypothetical protein